MQVKLYNWWSLVVADFFHSAQCFQGSPMLWHVSILFFPFYCGKTVPYMDMLFFSH